MTQQINLFNPVFRKQRTVLTLSRIAMCAVAAVAVMSGIWYYQLQVVNGLKAELAAAQNLLKAQRAYVDKVGQGVAATVGKPSAIELEIARLERELELGREQIAAIEGGIVGARQGFSEYLGAFSRQSLHGLWLTGLDISARGDITIRGRVLTPELVPDYLQRLNREQVLQGRHFASLEVRQPPADLPDGADKSKSAEPKARFLEFSLATADAAAATRGAAGASNR
jgi:hypothetical protein